jgi:hypothetical protein
MEDFLLTLGDLFVVSLTLPEAASSADRILHI